MPLRVGIVGTKPMLQSPPAPANSRTVSNPFRAADGPSGISKRSVSDESTDVDGSVATKGVYADTSVHPDLFNSRIAYVSVSRASHDAVVFTDDVAKLGPQLGADVSKTSALEINQTSSIAQVIGLGL